MIGLKRGTVKLLPHNPKWTEAFEKEKEVLSKALNGLVVDIQHIGSTSIPGIPAKPIIDISIGIKTMKNSKDFIKIFEDIGYEYRPDFGGPTIQLLFVKGPEEKRTHYIHLMKYNGSIWINDLAFRDYLRKNKDRAEQYANLKKKLAANFANDRTKYTASKANFILETVRIAKNGKATQKYQYVDDVIIGKGKLAGKGVFMLIETSKKAK